MLSLTGWWPVKPIHWAERSARITSISHAPVQHLRPYLWQRLPLNPQTMQSWTTLLWRDVFLKTYSYQTILSQFSSGMSLRWHCINSISHFPWLCMSLSSTGDTAKKLFCLLISESRTSNRKLIMVNVPHLYSTFIKSAFTIDSSHLYTFNTPKTGIEPATPKLPDDHSYLLN